MNHDHSIPDIFHYHYKQDNLSMTFLYLLHKFLHYDNIRHDRDTLCNYQFHYNSCMCCYLMKNLKMSQNLQKNCIRHRLAHSFASLPYC